MRGKENQEMGGLGGSSSKATDTEFTGTKSSHQTSEASNIDLAKPYDLNTHTDSTLTNKAQTDPSLNKMGGIFSSAGMTASPDALFEDVVGAREAGPPVAVVQGKLTGYSGDVAKSESSVSTSGSQETLFRHLGFPGPDAVGANYRAFENVELSPRLQELRNTDLAAFKVSHRYRGT